MIATEPGTPEEALERGRSREDRYKLGQFFTPEAIATFMGDAIMEVTPSSVLDPAVGGGILLRVLDNSVDRYGLDIDPRSVAAASAGLTPLGGTSRLAQADFLDPIAWPFDRDLFDAVIANPPYIRHHNLSIEHKALAAHYSRLFNAKVSPLSGSYVYFFLEAIQRLRPGGRLVFITPTEFLDARYGVAVKQALLKTCEINEILVLQQDDLAFDGVLTTSALTIATKTARPAGPVRLTEATITDSAVVRGPSITLVRDDLRPDLPWTPLLPTRAQRLRPVLIDRPHELGRYARARRGIATGDNGFFCLSQKEVEDRGIEQEFLVPVVIGSKDLPPSGSLTQAHWEQNLAQGRKGWLLWCHAPKNALKGTKVLDYIEHGESLALQDRFNCRSRSPWYSVEPVPPPDFFVTYMSRDAARIVRNLAGARCMTSLLNLWAKPPQTAATLEPVLHDPINAFLLREFGRTYGGGLGKIEPGDLIRLPVPVMDSSISEDHYQPTLELAVLEPQLQ